MTYITAPNDIYAMIISNDGELCEDCQILGFELNNSGKVVNCITFDKPIPIENVDIFATTGSFTVTSRKESGFTLCYHSIDDLIYQLECKIFDTSFLEPANWLDYKVNFERLEEITGLKYDRGKYTSACRKYGDAIKAICQKQMEEDKQ